VKKPRSRSVPWLRALLAIVLAGATMALRFPFASRTLFAWDSANFALALNHYNVAFHQPHPPGYPLYVAVASLINIYVLDANASFVYISIVASGLAVGILFLLASQMYDPWTGFVSATLMAVSVGFWGYGEVAYPYTALAFFSILMAWLCYVMWQGHRSVAVLSGLVLGIAGGIRQDVLIFMGPLWLISVWGTGFLRLVVSSVVLCLAVASWLYPAVQLSGGWEVFQRASAAQGYLVLPSSSVLYPGISGVRHNSLLLIHSLDVMFGATALVTLYGIGRFLTFKGLLTDQRLRFLLLWFLPPLLVYVLIHIGEPGYVLSIVPVLCIVTAVVIRDIMHDVRSTLLLLSSQSRRLRGLASLAGLGAVMMAVLIVLGLVAWNANAFVRTIGPARWSEIRAIDSIITGQVEYARRFQPDSVVILGKDRFRQMQYYLPGHNLRLLYDEFDDNYAAARYDYQVPEGITTVLLLDDPPAGGSLVLGAGVEATMVDFPNAHLWQFKVKPGDTIQYGYNYFGLKGRS
jgi:hypothetical protein